MMLQIMVYAIAVAVLLGAAGLCLERLAALHGLPRRSAWIAAMLLSILLPLVMLPRAAPSAVPAVAPPLALRSQPQPLPVAPPLTVATDSGSPAAAPVATVPQPPARQWQWRFPRPSDRFLAWSWALASLLLAGHLVVSLLQLRRRMAGWQHADLLGESVLVSERIGPALVGTLRPRIVVPRWLLQEPPATQALILQHEREHIAVRDPLLIRAGMLLLVALPWNLPLWWQWHRLRQAIELDCDARVLRAGVAARAYGETLLAVVGRAAPMPAGTVAMSEPMSALERRIRNLLPDPVRHTALQTVAAVALAALGAGIALAMDAPAVRMQSSAPRAPLPRVQGAPDAPAPLAAVSSPFAAATSPPAAATAAPTLAPAPVRTLMAAAASAPAAVVPDSDIPVSPRPATPSATPDAGARELALRAAVQRYPELLNGPPAELKYYVTMVVRADGSIFRSSLQPPMDLVNPATYGSGAMAGVVNLVLARRSGLPDILGSQRLENVQEGPNRARIPRGEEIADLGKASADIELLWRVLPADYDESRDSRRVTNAVRAKHDDLMLPTGPAAPMTHINLLTVFMNEDGQIEHEAVELLDMAQHRSMDPQPVNSEAIVNARGEPYTSYNPPPVPAEAFRVLGLDAARIGRTGLLLVGREPVDSATLRSMPQEEARARTLYRQVLVRYAWPRRPGEPAGGTVPAN